MLESLRTDLRVACRVLVRRPGFTLATVLTLALGIGATTAVYSVLRGVLLAPLPYAADVVEVRHRNEQVPQMDGRFSPQDHADLNAAGVFPRVAAYFHAPGLTGANVVVGDRAQRLSIAYVDGVFFETLGTRALHGRTIGVADARERARVVVLSERAWRASFDADASAVGSTIRIDNEAFTVAGVMPASFQYPTAEVDAWLPITLLDDDDVPHVRGLRWQGAIASLPPGVEVAVAARNATAVVERLAREHPETNEGWTRAEVVPLHAAITGDIRPALLVLMAAVGLVLLIACANVANLLLVHATRRAREVAVRAALGAGSARILRQLLTEHLVIALVGGMAGVGLAWLGVDALVALAGDRLPRAGEIGINGAVLLFALIVSVITGLLAGVIPALRATRANVQMVLREGGRSGSDGRSRAFARNVLVVAETGIAVVLVIGASLMVRSFARLTAVDPGFTPERVISFGVTMQSELFEGGPDEAVVKREAYRRRMFDALRQLPGVTAVGGSKTMPLSAGGEPLGFSSAAGAPSDLQPEGGAMIITPDYFRALGVPLLAGREFREAGADATGAEIIVNRSFARQYWPGRDPVGAFVYVGETPLAVVGVVPDIRHDGIAHPAKPTVYVPGTLAPRSSQKVFVRTNAEPAAAMRRVRDTMRTFDPELPIADLAMMTSVLSASVAQPRMLTMLLGLFGGFALLLAALGMYGVIAYGVAQRSQEIGIRMALGAHPGRVLRMVVGQAVALALGGIILGLLAAVLLTRLLRSVLFEVSATDPLTFAVVPVVLLVVAAAAALLPALRAARVDPARTMVAS